eukprot:3585073-Heterocapsa_arctica.AAC.1
MEFEEGKRLTIGQSVMMQISKIIEGKNNIICELTKDEKDRLQEMKKPESDRRPRPNTHAPGEPQEGQGGEGEPDKGGGGSEATS